MPIRLLCALFALAASAEAEMVTNSAAITTNLYFFLTAGTNYLDHSTFRSADWISYTIASRDKKPELFRCFPAQQAFELKLFDESGRPVPKTKLGLSWGAPVKAPKSMREASRVHGRPAGGTYYLFRPNDLFSITNKGSYALEVKLTLWARTTNNTPDIEPLIFHQKPPINANLHYGVVVSEPLHVRIIKD
jgi:hypothetical protein